MSVRHNIKFLLVVFVLLNVAGCERFGWKSFDYNTGEGAKLKVINKNKKDSGYYFTTRGPKMVLKKTLPKDWYSRYYDAVIDEFSTKPKRKKAIIYY